MVAEERKRASGALSGRFESVPISSKTPLKTAFDPQVFRKLAAMFDSNQPPEVEAAFHRAQEMCAKYKISFFQALTEALGPGGRAEQLEKDLATMRRVMEETLGEAEISLRDLRDENTELVGEVTRLRNAKEQNITSEPCYPCEAKRRVLAAILGIVISSIWFEHLPWFHSRNWQRGTGVGVALAPVGAVLCRWFWMRFKRNYAWVSLRDNGLRRELKTKWNGFLARFNME
jgi:hypothetical protein